MLVRSDPRQKSTQYSITMFTLILLMKKWLTSNAVFRRYIMRIHVWTKVYKKYIQMDMDRPNETTFAKSKSLHRKYQLLITKLLTPSFLEKAAN